MATKIEINEKLGSVVVTVDGNPNAMGVTQKIVKPDTNELGHVFGLILDDKSGKIISDVNVIKDPRDESELNIMMPFKGIGVYYAYGPLGPHRVIVKHNKYFEANIDIFLTKQLLERHIYLTL